MVIEFLSLDDSGNAASTVERTALGCDTVKQTSSVSQQNKLLPDSHLTSCVSICMNLCGCNIFNSVVYLNGLCKSCYTVSSMKKREAELCFGGNLVSPVHSPELFDKGFDSK